MVSSLAKAMTRSITASGPTRTCALGGTPSRQVLPRFNETSSVISCWVCQRATDPGVFAVFASLPENVSAKTQRSAKTLTGELMEFELNETQKLFQRSARELFAQECPPTLVREMIETNKPYSEAIWTKLVEQGWTGLIFSEDDGGLGLGMVEMAVAFEEMGRALVPGAFLSTVALAGSLIEQSCSPDYRAARLQAISEGRSKATVALLEEGASWTPDAVQMTATPTEGGFKLNGAKLFVSDASVSDCIITAVRIGSDLALAFVNSDAPGVRIKPMPGIDATRLLCAIEYDNVHVAADDVMSDNAKAH